MKIEIKSTEVKEETIRPSGKPGAKVFTPFVKRTQRAYVQLSAPNGDLEPYPTPFNVGLEQGQGAFPAGVYLVAPESFYVDRNGNLTLGRLRLKAVSASSVRSAA